MNTYGRRIAPRILLALGLLAACGGVRLISSYDEQTDRGVTALHGKMSSLFDRLAAENGAIPYGELAPKYDDIQHDLAALILRNEARDKNSLTPGQLVRLQEEVKRFEAVHRKQDKVSPDAVSTGRDLVDATVRAILKLELKKREG